MEIPSVVGSTARPCRQVAWSGTHSLLSAPEAGPISTRRWTRRRCPAGAEAAWDSSPDFPSLSVVATATSPDAHRRLLARALVTLGRTIPSSSR